MWMPPASWPAGAQAFFALWRRGGWIGVDLFFVLSGFLVSGLLFAEFKAHGRIAPLRFYARRAWKIYPPYFVMLAATVALILTQGGDFERGQLLAEVFFYQNYVRGLWNHTWSLAIEEHFYLLLPLVCLLVLRTRARRPASLRAIVLLGAGVGVVELAARIGNAMEMAPYSPYTYMFATHLRLDSLFFGVVLSYAYHFHTARFVELLTPWRVPLLLGGSLLLAPAFLITLESPLMYTVGYTVLYIGSGMLVVGALLSDPRRRRTLGALATLGAFSYSIYLWHMPVLVWGLPLLEQLFGMSFPFSVRLVSYVGGSMAMGVVMARLVEVPALRLRDQLFPARSTATIAARPTPVDAAPVERVAVV